MQCETCGVNFGSPIKLRIHLKQHACQPPSDLPSHQPSTDSAELQSADPAVPKGGKSLAELSKDNEGLMVEGDIPSFSTVPEVLLGTQSQQEADEAMEEFRKVSRHALLSLPAFTRAALLICVNSLLSLSAFTRCCLCLPSCAAMFAATFCAAAAYCTATPANAASDAASDASPYAATFSAAEL